MHMHEHKPIKSDQIFHENWQHLYFSLRNRSFMERKRIERTILDVVVKQDQGKLADVFFMANAPERAFY